MATGAALAPGRNYAASNYRFFKFYVYLFAVTLGIQTGHMLEHVTQVIQKFVLHVTPAHGLIGRLDLEQIHFGFNSAYLLMFFPLFLGWFCYRAEIAELTPRWKLLAGIFLITFIVQIYHQAEHTAKLVQYLNTHMQGTQGILGAHFDLVIMHFIINLLVYLPMLVVFFGGGLHRKLLPRSR